MPKLVRRLLELTGPLAVLALAAPAYGGTSPAGPAGDDAPRAGAPARAPSLLRTTLIVADVARSLAFYRVLGFHVVDELSGARDPVKAPFPLNAPARHYRLLVLASGTDAGGRLGLLAFDGPAPTPTRAARDRVGLGDAVLVVDVPDAAAAYAALRAAGATVVEAPQSYRSHRGGPGGRPLEGAVFHAFDPDGTLVELLEAPKPVDAP
jgi:catechol 2,3-dioxygenase-like lactoylglutathione lyase family enzyme